MAGAQLPAVTCNGQEATVPHRDDLAADLRRAVPPGEDVCWASPKALGSLAGHAVAIAVPVAVLIGAWFLWSAPGEDSVSEGRAILGMLFLSMALMGGLYLTSRAFGMAIVVTAETVLWRRGYLFAPISTVRRAEIAGVTGFEASDLVLLHRADGATARLTGVPEIREFLHVLGIPVELWPRRAAPKYGGWPARILIGGGGMVGATVFQKVGTGLFDGEIHSIGTVLWFGFLVLAVAALWLAGHWLNGRQLDPESRRATACHMVDPLCGGRDPWTAGHIPLLELPFVLGSLWIARTFYGIPRDCRADLAPEIIHPAAPAEVTAE